MQYIGILPKSGLLPYCASSSAARSSASDCLRNSSHTAGDPGGSGPADGRRSRSPLHVTDRSPRRLSVPSALICPELGTPIVIPYCCCTSGSDDVGSIRPNSMGGPAYSSKSGRIVAIATVSVGYVTALPARITPGAGGMVAPSRVTSRLLAPL